MIFDSHTHTKFSADSQMLATDAVARAESLNLGIVFTEHFDYDLEGNFKFVPAEYMSEYKNFRGDKVRLGVEVGFTKTARKVNKNFVASADFDQVIGSIHMLDGADIYHKEFFYGKDKISVYTNYFNVMAQEAAVNDFDVLGHIDYICRAATYDDTSIDYERFKNEIDKVLKIVVEREKVLELNTRRLNRKEIFMELKPVYESYKNVGGKYVTIGSDAHRAEVIGNYFEDAKKFVEEIGLTVVNFKQRKMQM
ncbi:MAG: histidinol-phosphatase HisJ family protein [Selenomonadaceae bacterium]|nr:histidinol-phosphatase HisJ family protein [Selenomonadaceae bacterium]